VIEFAVIGAAMVEMQAANARREAERVAARDLAAWEAEWLPKMGEVERAEYQRKKEREEDIRRQERQHCELVAAENRKARALEELARRRGPSMRNLAAGFILGEIVGK
jgi:hypothetical protein